MSSNLDLTILDGGDRSRAVVVARRGYDLVVEQLPLDELEALSAYRARIDGEIRVAGPTEPLKDEDLAKPLKDEDLVRFGKELFAFATRGKLGRLYAGIDPGEDVRIHIVSNRPEIQSLPWEFFQEPEQFGGPRLDRSIVRIVPTVGVRPFPPLPLRGTEPVRVLFVASAPPEQGAVSWPEVREYIHGIFTSRLPGRFEFVAVDGASRSSVLEALPERAFHILHFHGHGTVIDGTGHLVLTDRRTRASDFLPAPDLCAMVRARGLRLVILSACETSAGNFGEGFSVIAEALIQSGVPAVVANQMQVYDQTIAAFVRALYGELLRSGDIDRAVGEGRLSLFGDSPVRGRARLDWGIPTLYRHVDGAKVFQP